MKLPFSNRIKGQMRQEFPEYLAFREIVDHNNDISRISEYLLANSRSQHELLLSLRQWLNNYVYDRNKKLIRNAHNLLESRLTPATTVLETHMGSCGALATLASSILRSLNIPVKLIHGSLTPNMIDHAWIEVYFPDTREWQPFDLTGKGGISTGDITSHHRKIAECADWSDIKDILEEQHRTESIDKVT